MAAGRTAAERATSAQAQEARPSRPHAAGRRRAHLLRTTALATLVLASCLAQPALAEETDPSDQDAVGGAAAATTARGFGGAISIQALASGPGDPGDAARPPLSPAPSPAIGGAFASIASSAERLVEINERFFGGPGDALAGAISDTMTGVERSVVDHANQVREGRGEVPAHGREPRAPRSPAEPALGGSRDGDLVLTPEQTPPDGVAGGKPGDSALLPKPHDPEHEPAGDPRAPGGSSGVETPVGDGTPKDDRGETENPLPEGTLKDDPAAPGGSGTVAGGERDHREPPVVLPADPTEPGETRAVDEPAAPAPATRPDHRND